MRVKRLSSPRDGPHRVRAELGGQHLEGHLAQVETLGSNVICRQILEEHVLQADAEGV